MKKVIIFVLIIFFVIFSIKFFHIQKYLTQKSLHEFIDRFGIYAPLIFILVYSISPIFFLPGLPFALFSGAAFGPFWGVIYADIGATIGAALSFLLARYFLREWIEQKIKNTKIEKLNNDIEKNGWKVVALTRLIPLFPYNTLNYFFGITKIKFSHYFLATLIFMLPGCIGYVVFGSSIFDLLKGKISIKLIVGLFIIILISIFSKIYKKKEE